MLNLWIWNMNYQMINLELCIPPPIPMLLTRWEPTSNIKGCNVSGRGSQFCYYIHYQISSQIKYPFHYGPKLPTFRGSPWAIYMCIFNIHKHYFQTWLQRLRLLREGGVLFTNSNMMVRSVPSGEVPTETPANILWNLFRKWHPR